jgi:hypothetical protein
MIDSPHASVSDRFQHGHHQISAALFECVAKHFIAPAHVATDSLCIRIENNSVSVESMSVARLIRTAYPIAIQLPTCMTW